MKILKELFTDSVLRMKHAKASVQKLGYSSRSHAHKIQAKMLLWNKGRREMGKTSEAQYIENS